MSQIDERIDKAVVSVGRNEELEREEKRYWSRATCEEKPRSFTHLRECFYGPEATAGRLQRVHSVISKADLLRNKLASGRHRDLADAETLEGD